MQGDVVVMRAGVLGVLGVLVLAASGAASADPIDLLHAVPTIVAVSINISELQVIGVASHAVATGVKPIVRVGGFEQPALGQDDCAHALLPANTTDTIARFETIELAGGLALCRIDHLSSYSEPVMDGASVRKGTSELAIVKRAQSAVAVVARKSWPIAAADPNGAMGMAPVTETSITVTAIQLTSQEVAVLVDDTTGQHSPQFDAGGTTSTLFRVGASGFAAVLDFASSWSDGETATSSRCALQPFAPTDALPALAVVCEDKHERYPGAAPGEDHDANATTTTRYHWAGGRYRK